METPHGLAHGGSLSLKTALFIDGGHLRALVRQAGRSYIPDYIEAVAHACMTEEETPSPYPLLRLRALSREAAPSSSAKPANYFARTFTSLIAANFLTSFT